MSEIPYFFETPVPKYFRENGWFDSEHMFKYVIWAFSRCRSQPHKVVIEGREITLAPFEFISGRLTSSKECFLTENIFRNQQKIMLKAGLLKKSTNSLTNHFTCYIWVTERFYKINNQPNNQPLTNHQPTINHKEDIKKEDIRRNQPQTPSSSAASDGLVGSVPSNEEKIWSCLEEVYQISVLDKIRLTKKYAEVDIARGVSAFLAQDQSMIRDPVGYIVAIAKRRELAYVEINRAWVQKEIFDDNPGIFNHLSFSGNFICDKADGKELSLTMIPEAFQRRFMEVFITPYIEKEEENKLNGKVVDIHGY